MPATRVDLAALANGRVDVWLSAGRDWTVTQIHCNNRTGKGAEVTIYKDGLLLYQFRAQPHKKSAWKVRGIRLGQHPDYWDDIEEKWQPRGVDMKDYIFSASWPLR